MSAPMPSRTKELQAISRQNSDMCHPRCVYKLIGGGIESITQQVYLIMFIRGR